MEIQNEYVKLILLMLLRLIKFKDVGEAMQIMEDLGLTNDHLKEHLMLLCMDPKTVEAFESLDSTTKAAFTREYNKQHKDDYTGGKGKKGGKKGTAAAKPDDEGEEEEEAGDEKALLDEEQIREIKLGKKLEREAEERAKVDKSDKFELLKLQADGKKKPAGKKRAPAKKGGAAKRGGGKTRGKKESDDEIGSDDSLNDFIVGDDEDIEYDRKKNKKKKK